MRSELDSMRYKKAVLLAAATMYEPECGGLSVSENEHGEWQVSVQFSKGVMKWRGDRYGRANGAFIGPPTPELPWGGGYQMAGEAKNYKDFIPLSYEDAVRIYGEKK